MSEASIIRILKDVARISIPEDDCGYWCPFCNASSVRRFSEIDDVKHEADCDVLLARQELQERGTPMRVYHVTGEYVCAHPPGRAPVWTSFQAYTLAAHKEDLDTWESTERRNIKFAYARELKPEEGGMREGEESASKEKGEG